MRLSYRIISFAVIPLVLFSSAAPAAPATEPAARPADVPLEFVHDGITLHGLLILPTGTGPFPTAILVPGFATRKSKITAEDFRYMLSLGRTLAAQGIAAFWYDHPGSHGQKGDWRLQTLYDRADEVLAAVDFLRTQPQVDPRHIGLIGHSNGGWVSPLAASLMPEKINFVVTLAGPAVSIESQGLYAARKKLEKLGLSAEQIEQTLAVAREVGEMVRLACEGKETQFKLARDKLLHDLDSLSDWRLKVMVLFLKANLPTWEERSDMRNSMEANFNYDPEPALRKLRCPLFAALGADDEVVNSEESAAIYRKCLDASHSPDCRVTIYPKEDHGVGISGVSQAAKDVAAWVGHMTGVR